MRPLLAYDEIFLSPHLDDAALSCGGQIAQATREGAKVLVISVFAGDPPEGELSSLARELHQLWGHAQEPFVARRAEDVASSAVLHADFEHWDFHDAIYRRDFDGRLLYGSRLQLFADPDPADASLLGELTRRFSAFAGLAVRAPMAIGGHVDHRLVRLAAEAAKLDGLELYEDFPYARSRKQRWLARGFALGWHGRILPLEPEDLDKKIEAITCFASQTGSIFASPEILREEVEKFARARGGERLYYRP